MTTTLVGAALVATVALAVAPDDSDAFRRSRLPHCRSRTPEDIRDQVRYKVEAFRPRLRDALPGMDTNRYGVCLDERFRSEFDLRTAAELLPPPHAVRARLRGEHA